MLRTSLASERSPARTACGGVGTLAVIAGSTSGDRVSLIFPRPAAVERGRLLPNRKGPQMGDFAGPRPGLPALYRQSIDVDPLDRKPFSLG
ncbi:hypothetical protein GCM10027176_27720 [Actinoallomurus bryophytorum]